MQIYISWIFNYNNLKINYKYNELLILTSAPPLILSSVQSPFPALAAVIFVSILGFVMLLVTIFAVAYKVVSKRREQRRMMDLPMQVLGIEDENTNPVLVVLGESLVICEKKETNMDKWVIETDRTLCQEERHI